MVASFPPVKVVEAVGEVIYESSVKYILLYLVHYTHEDVGKSRSREGEDDKGGGEHLVLFIRSK